MSENFTISTRIKHKYKTEAEWKSYGSFVPLSGELIIYAPDKNYKTIRLKVGDGDTPLSSLKFFESGGEEGKGILSLLQEHQNEAEEIWEDLYMHLGELGDLLTDQMTPEGLEGDMKTEIPTARAVKDYVQNSLNNSSQIQIVTWDPDD